MDISGMNKAEVLAALYNASRQQGMGFLDPDGQKQMNVEQAKKELERTTYLDYLNGRVMKIDLSSDELRTALYNRDNGQNAAEDALSHLRK